MMKTLSAVLGALLISIAAGLTPPWARAGDPDGAPAPQPHSLRALIDTAIAGNPEIKAARARWRKEVEGYRVAVGLPDPQVMGTYFPEPIETRLGPQDYNLTVTQMIPFPGKLSKAGQVAEARAEIANADMNRAVREVVLKVKESFYERYYIEKALAIADQNEQLLAHFNKVAADAYADDRAVLFDVVKAQSQMGQVQYDKALLADLMAAETARLNTLLNRPPEAPLPPPGDVALPTLAYGVGEMYALIEQTPEEVRMADARIRASERKLDLARMSALPDFRVGLFYAQIGKPDVAAPPKDAGRDAVGIQAGVTVPFWWGKNKSRNEAARSEVTEMESMRATLVNDLKAKVAALVFKLENSEKLVDLYSRTLVPQAAHSLEQAETLYENGHASFADVLEARAVWQNFALAVARARADYGKAFARLERILAVDPGSKPDDAPNAGTVDRKETP